jgi:hypothetical protein
MGTILTVRDAEGGAEPLRERTLAARVTEALAAAGGEDPALAEELAAAVWSFVERAYGKPGAAPAAAADVDRLVENALRDAGREDAARAYAEDRKRRERLRRELIVVLEAERADAPELEILGGEAAPGRHAPWRADYWSRLVAKESELPAALADEITALVERRLAALGQRTATERLVRELLQAELAERGLAGDLVGGGFSISRREVARALTVEAEPPEHVVAGALFAAAAREELPAATLRAERSGLLHLFRSGRPAALERLAASTFLLAGESARGMPPARLLLRVRAALERLRPHAAGTIELPDVVGVAAAAAADSGVEDPAAVAADLETALVFENAFGAAVGATIEVAAPLDGFRPGEVGRRERAVVAAFLTRLAATPHLRTGLRVLFSTDGGFAHDPDRDALFAPVATLLRARADAALLPRRAGAVDPFGRDPADPNRRRLRLSPLRVALNLPMALLGARGASLAAVLEEAKAAVRPATDAFHDALWRQRRGEPYGVHGVVVMFGGPAAVSVEADGQEADLEIWGLPLALELLVRRDVVARSRIAEAAARLLGFLDYEAGEDRNGLSLRVRLGGLRDRDVRVRFHRAFEHAATAAADAAALAALKRSRGGEGVLPVAPPLLDPRNAPLWSAPAAERFGPGLGIAESAAPGGLNPAFCAAVVAGTRLGRFALAPADAGDGLFEVQEELFR